MRQEQLLEARDQQAADDDERDEGQVKDEDGVGER